MTTNRYLNLYQQTSEQNLVEDILIESIKMWGIDTYYLPRALQKEDLIYGEDVVSKFKDYFTIEVYIKNVDGFQGKGDLFRKFGLEIQDQATLIISRRRFNEECAQDIDPPRPREGDLMFFPLNGALMEIKFVSNEKMAFYPLGEWYTYQIDIQQFNYSHEDIVTGIPEIDQVQPDYTYQIDLTLGVGSGVYQVNEEIYQGTSLGAATAKAIVINHDTLSNKLRIRDIVGSFADAINVIGNTSAASYAISVVDPTDILADASATNKPAEVEALTILDTSEYNPFSNSNE